MDLDSFEPKGRVWFGLTRAFVSLRSGDALTAFGGGLRSAGDRFSEYCRRSTVLRTVSLFSFPGLGIVTPVISSQTPHHRLLSPASHGPFHGPFVAVVGSSPSCSFPG